MFITIEGTEGCGKTTLARLLGEALTSEKHNVVITREPGWGPVGKCLRELLLDDKNLELDPFAELCLFCADRAEHVRSLICPSLDGGQIVICDRFSDSTVAYQGYGRGLDLALVKKLAWEAALDTVPEVTILLDLPIEQGLERINGREGRTKMDDEGIRFHTRVRKGYLEIASAEPKRVRRVDASRGIEEVAEEALSIVTKELA